MSVVYRFRPKVTEGNETFDALYGVEYDEVTAVNASIRKLFDNDFIKTADLDGIRKFEKIYAIEENANFTLEQRRQQVYDRMIYKPPFTRQKLTLLLNNILGEGNYKFILDPENFTLIIAISQLDRTIYENYIERIREIIPSNIYLIPSTPYTYLFLTGLVHGTVRSYTDVGAGNGDYILASPNNYVFVKQGNGNFVLPAEHNTTDDTKLSYYTYRQLSMYSVFDTTLELFAVDKTITIVDGDEVISSTKGEIVTLGGAGIAYVSEM